MMKKNLKTMAPMFSTHSLEESKLEDLPDQGLNCALQRRKVSTRIKFLTLCCLHVKEAKH